MFVCVAHLDLKDFTNLFASNRFATSDADRDYKQVDICIILFIRFKMS